jgi:hypothetical protein
MVKTTENQSKAIPPDRVLDHKGASFTGVYRIEVCIAEPYVDRDTFSDMSQEYYDELDVWAVVEAYYDDICEGICGSVAGVDGLEDSQSYDGLRLVLEITYDALLDMNSLIREIGEYAANCWEGTVELYEELYAESVLEEVSG